MRSRSLPSTPRRRARRRQGGGLRTGARRGAARPRPRRAHAREHMDLGTLRSFSGSSRAVREASPIPRSRLAGARRSRRVPRGWTAPRRLPAPRPPSRRRCGGRPSTTGWSPGRVVERCHYLGVGRLRLDGQRSGPVARKLDRLGVDGVITDDPSCIPAGYTPSVKRRFGFALAACLACALAGALVGVSSSRLALARPASVTTSRCDHDDGTTLPPARSRRA